MFYVAVTPAPVLAAMLLALLGLLVWGYWHRRDRPLALPFCLFGVAQTALALTALYLTAQRSISKAACLTGIIGAQASMLVGLILLGSLFAFLIAARQKVLMTVGGNKAFFGSFAALQIAVILTLMRSALLCTV